MTFTVSDFRDWIHILYDHPEWREEFRRAALTDEILELPGIVRELADSHRELVEAHRELVESVRELSAAQTRLGSAVGELQRAFGATIEEEAASVVEVILRRKGYRILQPAYSLALNGEIDVVLPVEALSGEAVWAVVEAKARLSQRDVHAWSRRMRSEDWQRRLAEKGVKGPYLVYAYSIRADLGAQEIAGKEGIGLLKSDGETLSPRDLIQPPTA
ncbi:MAG: hypothetical protein COS37_05700 [Anaerolineae bacterium CG03_land_8_20_14_0_80_58_20]|nr:MAG: hypothetical protein AUJ21_12425 [Anaerolineae bacterium CG1_02_58_13]PIV26573.1 MAG: hypothetical protein COS37_05700 [Anaerolineae bacterium CG03_land_8_20_14_0_80_58_20]